PWRSATGSAPATSRFGRALSTPPPRCPAAPRASARTCSTTWGRWAAATRTRRRRPTDPSPPSRRTTTSSTSPPPPPPPSSPLRRRHGPQTDPALAARLPRDAGTDGLRSEPDCARHDLAQRHDVLGHGHQGPQPGQEHGGGHADRARKRHEGAAEPEGLQAER